MAATVIVVGAGPVGQTAALLLAGWGLDVSVLDAAPARALAGSRSICQQRDVLDIWNHVGAHAIQEEGLTWTTARTFYRGRSIAESRFEVFPGTPPFVNLSQTRTEAILDRLIDAEPRIRLWWNQPVTRLIPGAESVSVHTPTDTYSADYAVLASGAHGGPIRDQLDIEFPGSTCPDRFLICDVAADIPQWRTERHFHFDPPANPGRQLLIHPCPDDTFRIDWQVPPDYNEATDRLDRRVHDVIGDRDYRLLWNTTYRFHSRVADRFNTGRILLAGDVAHLCAPFGARGLNSGVPDAENAAWKIAVHAHGWAADSILDSYHAERYPAALENQRVVDTTMRFLAPATDHDRRYRHDLLDAAVTDPGAAADIDSGRFAEPYWYSASPLTTPDPDRPEPRRPAKNTGQPAAPGVIFPDGPPDMVSLRPSLRGAFTLVTRDERPDDWFHRETDAPTRYLALDRLERGEELAEHMGLSPGECWLVRPDAHLAATLPEATPATVTAALRRALGHAAGLSNDRPPTRNKPGRERRA